MEFKRTSEGRVFFSRSKDQETKRVRLSERQSSDALAGDKDTALTSPLTGRRLERPITTNASGLPSAGDAASQYQVLSLLKSLNEKLKLTHVERNSMRQELKAYKQMIAKLERRSAQSEHMHKALQAQIGSADVPSDIAKDLEETRRLYEKLESRAERHDRSLNDLLDKAENHRKLSASLSQKQSELERLTHSADARLEREHERVQDLSARLSKSESTYDDMREKLSNALKGEERFAALLEQDRADRARFMRKLERLEETVSLAQNAAQKSLGSDIGNTIDADAEMQKESSSRKVDEATREATHYVEQGYGEHIPHYLLNAQTDKVAFEKSTSILDIVEQRILRASRWFSALSPAYYIGAAGVILLIGLASNDARVMQLINARNDISLGAHSTQQAQNAAPLDAAVYTPPAVKSSALTSSMPTPAEQARLAQQMEQNAAKNAAQIAAQLNAIAPGFDPAQQPFTAKTPSDKVAPIAPPIADAELSTTDNADIKAPVVQPVLAQNETAASSASAVNDTPVQSAQSALASDIQILQNQADQGNHEAQHDLAALYVVGERGLPQDYQRAAYWFDKAAQGGIANATYNMGVLYHQGLGVARNEKAAIEWYRAAAEQGHPEAAYNLGISYIEGVGVAYDPFKASIHFEKAAQEGIGEASYNLGLIYENGLLGQPKPGDALMWYKQAADSGLQEAETALNQLVLSLGIDRNEINQIIEKVRSSLPDQSVSTDNKQQDADLLAEKALYDQELRDQLLADERRAELIRLAQEHLLEFDLYPGPVDGRAGPMTQDAVRAYQKAYDLDVDGDITQNLLDHMQGL